MLERSSAKISLEVIGMAPLFKSCSSAEVAPLQVVGFVGAALIVADLFLGATILTDRGRALWSLLAAVSLLAGLTSGYRELDERQGEALTLLVRSHSEQAGARSWWRKLWPASKQQRG